MLQAAKRDGAAIPSVDTHCRRAVFFGQPRQQRGIRRHVLFRASRCVGLKPAHLTLPALSSKDKAGEPPSLRQASEQAWCVRRRLDNLRVFFNVPRDLAHGVYELIQRFFAFGLGRLDHQSLRDDEREVDGRRMVAEVHQALRDIQRFNAMRLLLTLC